MQKVEFDAEGKTRREALRALIALMDAVMPAGFEACGGLNGHDSRGPEASVEFWQHPSDPSRWFAVMNMGIHLVDGKVCAASCLEEE